MKIALIWTDLYLLTIFFSKIEILSLNLLQKICFFLDFLIILLKNEWRKYVKRALFLLPDIFDIVFWTKLASVKSFYSNLNKLLVLFRHTGMPVHGDSVADLHASPL